jgi:hypothetical protein
VGRQLETKVAKRSNARAFQNGGKYDRKFGWSMTA